MYRNVTISCRTHYIYISGLEATYKVSDSWQKKDMIAVCCIKKNNEWDTE